MAKTKKAETAKNEALLDDKTIRDLVSVWYLLGIEAYWLFDGIDHMLDAIHMEEYWVPEVEKEVAEWRRVLS